jgi:transposase-like protein
MVAAVFRTILVQPDPATVAASWDESVASSPAGFPKIGTQMDNAKTEVLAFTAFPRPHWPKIWSTNPLERINKEIKRRARVVGKFPTNLRSSASSAPSWPTCTTSGSQANAATSPSAHGPTQPDQRY